MSEVEQMTAAELNEWAAYERVFGSLILGERIDAGFAMLAAMLAQAFGRKGTRAKPRDYMPPWYRELDAEQQLAQGWAALAALAQGNGDHADDQYPHG